jgi:hypothetical protein
VCTSGTELLNVRIHASVLIGVVALGTGLVSGESRSPRV